ncbi:ABC transporter substrate-binding protein [Clostridium sp. BSD9I1]|uniref:ABC transporter substrate-binding protein n=1 Tax=Clostridium sp. BSD9I1 TaxID=2003589 RepID=UPI0016488E06|nr:ABC transporter substrate-binding protein [Clostridium sp. BSD9I1]
MKNIKKLSAVLLAVMMAFAVGCSSKKTAEDTTKENLKLKVGVMPAVDSAPIFLAAKKGYFKELGLDVDVQVYTNAMNRQSALQSGELDGAMTDVIALVNNVQNGFDIKVTTSTDGSFPFLIKKGFEEKKDIKVGMMEVSVSNYLSDRSLGDKYNVEKVYINEIPARLEMINKGNLDMAVIPEPMASQGELNGLGKKLIQNTDEFSPDIMVFTGKAIKENEKAVKLFHEGYNKAIEEINKSDTEAREILIEKLKLKPEIKDKIILPKYNKARVPSKEYLETIMNWNEKVLKKKIDLKYEDLVEGKFVK